MCLFKKKNKNIVFWCITDKNNEDLYYTFTNTFAEVSEYLVKLYVYQHRYEHFLVWCETRNKDKNNIQTIYEYVQSLEINLFDYYTIRTIEYTPHNLVSLFRVYNQCIPLNCSFETEFEQKAYIDFINSNKIKENNEKDVTE